jgi:hypothetical protein
MFHQLRLSFPGFIAGPSLVLWMGCFCLLGKLLAHPDTQLQIDQTTAALAKPGANPELFLSRAYLHLEHEDFTSALADYRAFAKAQPESPAGISQSGSP